MPGNTIELEFADGEYLFALPLARIAELERKCGLPGPPVGIGTIFGRVLKGCIASGNDVMLAPGQAEFFVTDLVETLRQGLIGGKKGVVNEVDVVVTPALAERLIQGYVLDRPLIESWSLATSVLGACIMGYDPPKKELPASERAQTTTADDSTTD